MQKNHVLSRREVMAGLGMLSLASGVSAARTDPPALSSKPVVAIDDETFGDFIRLRTAPDLTPVLWVYSGVLVAKPVGQVAQAVARIEGVSRSRATPAADGHWLWELDEAGYYCDLKDGRPTQAIINPFTGKTVQPKHYRSPQALRFSKQGITPDRGMPAGVEFRGEITKLAEIAGTTALTEDLYVRLPGRDANADLPARPARFAASLAMFTTRTSSLRSPQRNWLDCQFNYTTLNSFVDWLGMQGDDGVQDMRIIGIKCRGDDLTGIPPWLIDRVNADHPDLLAKWS